jgi:hypothetical protein
LVRFSFDFWPLVAIQWENWCVYTARRLIKWQKRCCFWKDPLSFCGIIQTKTAHKRWVYELQRIFMLISLRNLCARLDVKLEMAWNYAAWCPAKLFFMVLRAINFSFSLNLSLNQYFIWILLRNCWKKGKSIMHWDRL